MVDLLSKSSPKTNVVSIDSAYLFTKLPSPFPQVKDRAIQGLVPLLQSLFDHCDDALFELADKADNNASQNMYFEAMREVRLQRRAIERHFVSGILDAFIALVKPAAKDADDLQTADNLAMVSHDELEELMASKSLITKIESRYNHSLSDLISRLDSLLVTETVSLSNLPIGPAVICTAFMQACRTLAADINAKLVLFKLFERHVIEGLGEIYESCNRLLADAGVVLVDPVTNKSIEPAEDLSEQLTAEHFPNIQQIFDSLTSSTLSLPAGIQTKGAAPLMPRQGIMALLQLAQQQLSTQSVDVTSVPSPIDVQRVLNEVFLQHAPEKTASVGQPESEVINLVAMLFQFVLEDRNLAAPIKVLLSKLQIPIIKIAMQDKTFFTRGGHPARKLVNAMATACLGWEEPEELERDPVYKKVSVIVNRLLNEFQQDGIIFEEILTEFNAFIEVERRRARMIEQRTIDAEDGKAKSELARQGVKAYLDRKLLGLSVPRVVETLLRDAWSNVLFLQSLKAGEESDIWKSSTAVVDDLLWSVQPMASLDDRKQLLKLIPNLLKSLREGLMQIAFNPFEMNRLFDELEDIHLAQLKQPIEIAVADDMLAVLPAKSDSSNQPVMEDVIDTKGLTLDQLLDNKRESLSDTSVESLDSELSDVLGLIDDLEGFGDESKIIMQPSSTHIAEEIDDSGTLAGVSLEGLRVGHWIEMLDSEGATIRCRLAAIIRGTGTYIFVNRSGIKVMEHTVDSLTFAVQAGEIKLLEDGLLFDRALEFVIGNMREMKSHNG